MTDNDDRLSWGEISGTHTICWEMYCVHQQSGHMLALHMLCQVSGGCAQAKILRTNVTELLKIMAMLAAPANNYEEVSSQKI